VDLYRRRHWLINIAKAAVFSETPCSISLRGAYGSTTPACAYVPLTGDQPVNDLYVRYKAKELFH